MTVEAGSKSGRQGLFASLKNLLATSIAIGKARAELLVTEIEEEKYRLISLWGKAIGAALLLTLGLIMAVLCLAFMFWEQRVIVFGVFAIIFGVAGFWLIGSLRRQAAQPSKLFRASLAELEEDIAHLRRRDSRSA
jgi:uncharacterized membrane protein YqjE